MAVTIEHIEQVHEDRALESVLLVDDNPINLQILHSTLKDCGYNLIIAKDGEAALKIANKVIPSLILLDIMLPGMDGYEVCEQLKSQPITSDIAVIFLSALEDSNAKVKGFSVGGVDYISKPFQADEVVARVRNHIKMHRLERQLALRNVELEAENHQILNTISEGIIALDSDGRISSLNPAATSITGWSAADIIGESLASLNLFSSHDSRLKKQDALLSQSYKDGKVVSHHVEVMHRRSGRPVSVALVSTPRVEGGAVLVLRDISEWVASEEKLRNVREELESQRQHMAHMERLSTMGEMAAGIAHEVNQPLTAVANYSQVARRLLSEEQLDKEQLMELMKKLNRQSVRASHVIKRMRSFVKKTDTSLTQVNINDVVRDVVALAEVDSRINDVGIDFEFLQDASLVTIDVVQIQQVTLNLIRNAMEATTHVESEYKSVSVRIMEKDKMIFTEVVDNGSGIDESVRDNLFSPFYSTKSTGMGIGLSICQSIIHRHGGSIGFYDNSEGDGATFFFSLPVDK